MQAKQSHLKNASPIIKFISTKFLIITPKKKLLNISPTLVKFSTLNFSQLKETGKTPKKNLTLTIVTSDLKRMRTQKNVFLLKKDIPLKTMTPSVLLEPIKLDKMMRLIRNFSLKSVQLSKRLKLQNFKNNFTYFWR